MNATNTTERPTWAVKCDDCKTTIRRTENVLESYAGGTCDTCRAMDRERIADRLAEMDVYTR